MNRPNLFPKDFKASKALNEFLQQNFYNVLKSTEDSRPIYHLLDYEISDYSDDFRGIDLIFKATPLNDPSQPIFRFSMDEKATLDYKTSKKPLSTFAFELGYLKTNKQSGNKEYREGWLTNPDKVTDYYILVWPHALWQENSYSFDVAEIMIISREDVIAILKEELPKNIHYNRDTLIDQLRNESQEVVRQYQHDFYNYKKEERTKKNYKTQENYIQTRYVKKINPDIKFMHSLQKKEAPLNIIINKQLLFKKAHCVFFINNWKNVKRITGTYEPSTFDEIKNTLDNDFSIPSL